MNEKNIQIVLSETKRCIDLFNAYTGEDEVTIYSSIGRPLLYEVCFHIRHKLANKYIAVITSNSTLRIKKPYRHKS